MLEDKITVTVNGKEVELFMSFGLKNTLARTFGSFENLSNLAMDADLRDKVLETLLVERDKNGKIKGSVDLSTVDISSKDVSDLFQWVMDHMYDFFLSLLGATLESQAKVETRLKEYEQRLSGGKT